MDLKIGGPVLSDWRLLRWETPGYCCGGQLDDDAKALDHATILKILEETSSSLSQMMDQVSTQLQRHKLTKVHIMT